MKFKIVSILFLAFCIFHQTFAQKPEKKILVISNFYGVKEIDINGKTSINFTFDRVKTESNKILKKENETINFSYGKMKKRDNSFSVSKLDGNKSGGQLNNNIYPEILN